jgi:hypothetical protein
LACFGKGVPLKTIWKKRQGKNRLILVLNGFAMDPRPLSGLEIPENADLVILGTYHDLGILNSDELAILSYPRVDVVAWSLGVWVFGQIGDKIVRKLGTRVAVNGTLRPLDAKLGIPPAIFALTRERFGLSTRGDFYRRVCSDPQTEAWFLALQPERTAEDQALELAFLHEELLAEKAPRSPGGLFHTAFVGSRDQIFPVASQERFWKGHVVLKVLDAGHYPFGRWSNWDDLFFEASSGATV